MNILFLNAYFSPETIAFSHLEHDIINALVNAGHHIQLICPTPSRGLDDGTIKKYKAIKSEDLYNGYVHVRRFACPKEKKNPIIRAIRYLWCNLCEYFLAKKYKNIDIVFAVSTPPTQGLLGVKVAKKLSKIYKRKVPFIYILQDIFPDSLATTKLAKKEGLIWKIGKKIERETYANADKIIVISQSFKHNILNKGVPDEKITVIPNWIDTNLVKPIDRNANSLFDEFNIPKNKFLVVYAGNFGRAQGANIILESAEILKEEKNIKFIIFGSGVEYDITKDKAVKLDNVIINPLLPAKKISEVYSLGDVVLITCKKGVGGSGMPSKTWSIMACNTPIIASFDTDSELSEIINKAGAGVCVEPENAKALAEKILWAKANKITCNSRAYVIENAEKEKCVSKYVELVAEFIKLG